jgi:hypothetical protein
MITKEELMDWVGNQGYADKQMDWMSQTLLEIANGEFTGQQLHDDVKHYSEQ